MRFEDDSVESAKIVKQWNVKIISVSTFLLRGSELFVLVWYCDQARSFIMFFSSSENIFIVLVFDDSAD